MQFEIIPFQIKHRSLPTKRGFLLEKEGCLSEVSPLPGWNKESTDDVLEQLQAVKKGWKGPLYPSVEFGLYGLTCPRIDSIPCALFLCGTPDEVLKTAALAHGCTTAKLKVGRWSLEQALDTIPHLPFKLRIDFNNLWDEKDVHALCSHLNPEHIEFLEDPGCTVPSFKHASDATNVWKPMVWGLPPPRAVIILSSSFESSIGLHQIAALTQTHEIPSHILGLGTILHLENDLVQNSATLKNGHLNFAPRLCDFASLR
jgi:O-succinylbenzoate synthase